MRRALLLLALAGCAARPGREAPAVEREALGLPAVRAPLVFPPEAAEVTLAWLVDELARATGQELSMDPRVRSALESSREPLEIRTSVPAAEVYPFVEGLLVSQGFLIAPLKGGERPLLGVYEPTGQPLDAQPVAVEHDDLPALARHPALFCQVLLAFENVDSRQLQTQLRALLVDSGGVQQVVPVGERCLLLRGWGAKVCGLARTLEVVDRASAAPGREMAAR